MGAAANSHWTRRSRVLDRGSLHFERLAGTRVEGERIALLLGVRPWLEGAALEGCLKACHSPRILHVATHGFFFEDQKRDPNQEPAARGLMEPGPGGTVPKKTGDSAPDGPQMTADDRFSAKSGLLFVAKVTARQRASPSCDWRFGKSLSSLRPH